MFLHLLILLGASMLPTVKALIVLITVVLLRVTPNVLLQSCLTLKKKAELGSCHSSPCIGPPILISGNFSLPRSQRDSRPSS